MTKAYGLYQRIGLDALNIAHPATLVIDRHRDVRFIYRGGNQVDRPPLEQVIAAAKGLGKGSLQASATEEKEIQRLNSREES